MPPPYFNETAWIERLAAALEHVAAAARPSYYPPPTELGGYRSSDERQSALNRAYLDLAARAQYDPTASIQFKESYLQVNADPVEAMAILREHPLIAPALVGSGGEEAVGFRILGKTLRATLHGLVARLAKLSIKDGGKEAALCLHRYLTAGANGTVPAHEITVVHGLVVKTRFNLDAGAYLAPYGEARAEFGLPDDPEPLSNATLPEAAVLVRSLEYGPGVVPIEDDYGLPLVQISYRFPAEHWINLERWFEDRLLVDLLSIATRFPLLSRTRHVRLPGWVEDIDPNFAHGFQQSAGNASDVWPAGHDLSTDDVASFLEMARGWRTYADRPDAMNLATRSTGRFVLPSGRPMRKGKAQSTWDWKTAFWTLPSRWRCYTEARPATSSRCAPQPFLEMEKPLESSSGYTTKRGASMTCGTGLCMGRRRRLPETFSTRSLRQAGI